MSLASDQLCRLAYLHKQRDEAADRAEAADRELEEFNRRIDAMSPEVRAIIRTNPHIETIDIGHERRLVVLPGREWLVMTSTSAYSLVEPSEPDTDADEPAEDRPCRCGLSAQQLTSMAFSHAFAEVFDPDDLADANEADDA